MGNASKPAVQPAPLQPVYQDPGVRTIRQLQTFLFPQTVTSAATLATANALPLITQGSELWNGVFTAASLESLIEAEISTNVTGNAGVNFWIALFADYSTEALSVSPGVVSAALAQVYPVTFKHFFQPVTLGPVRYSLRMAPSASNLIANWFAYGGRNASRITFTEYSGPSIRPV